MLYVLHMEQGFCSSTPGEINEHYLIDSSPSISQYTYTSYDLASLPFQNMNRCVESSTCGTNVDIANPFVPLRANSTSFAVASQRSRALDQAYKGNVYLPGISQRRNSSSSALSHAHGTKANTAVALPSPDAINDLVSARATAMATRRSFCASNAGVPYLSQGRKTIHPDSSSGPSGLLAFNKAAKSDGSTADEMPVVQNL